MVNFESSDRNVRAFFMNHKIIYKRGNSFSKVLID